MANLSELMDASAETAIEIRRRMEDLQIKELEIAVGKLVRIEGKTNVGYYSALRWNDSSGDLTTAECAEDSGYYVHGDYHHWIQYPNQEEILLFVANLDDIRAELERIANEQAARIDAALAKLQ